jgi:hypothetical protein
MRDTVEIDQLIAAAEVELARLGASRAEILKQIKYWQREKGLSARASPESAQDN